VLAQDLWGKSYSSSTFVQHDFEVIMVVKRKTVSKLANALKVTKPVVKDDAEDEEMDAQIVPVEEEKKRTQ